MTSRLPVFRVIVCLAILAGGCAPVVREVNRQWPRVSPAEHQQRAVSEATASFVRVANPMALVSVDAAALSLVADEAKKRLQSAYAADPFRVTIDALELQPTRQDIVVRTRAGLTFDDGRSELAGTFELHFVVSVDRANLVFRPAFSNLSLTRVKYRGAAGRGVVLELVNAAIGTLLNNINGAIQSQRIPLGFGHVATMDPSDVRLEVPPGLPVAIALTGTPVSVGVALGQTAVLVDEGGIFALAEAYAPTDRWLAASAASLRSRMSQSTGAFIPASEDLALLAFCGAPVAAVPDLAALCSWAEARSSEPATTAAPSTTFEAYRAAFLTKMVPLADGTAGATVAASLSRRELATATNAFLVGAHASGTATLDSYTLPDFSSTLRLPPTTQLNCTAPDRFPGCNSDFDRWHDQHYGPYSERPCPGHCGTFDFSCHGWKLDCERLKVQEKAAYEAAKAARRAQFTLEKAACEIRKQAQVTGCQANQAWLDHWGDKDVGEVKATSRVSNAGLEVSLDSARVSDDFSAVSLATRLAGGVDVSAGITLTPHNEGHIVCWSEWKGDTSTRVSIQALTSQLSGVLSGAGPQRSFRTTPFDLKISLDPHPLKKLLLDDMGELFMKCPLPTVLTGGPASVAPILLAASLLLDNPSRTVTVPPLNLMFEIPVLEKAIGGRMARLTGDLTPAALVFRAEVADIPQMDRVTMPDAANWPVKVGVWFASTAAAFGDAPGRFRKDISVPMPFVGLRVLNPRLRVFASLAPGPSFRGPGPTFGLAVRPLLDRPVMFSVGVRVPTGTSNRLYNPVRLLIGIGIEK